MKSLRTQPTLLALSILASIYTPAALAAPIALVPGQMFSSSFSFNDSQLDNQNDASATNAVSASSSLSNSVGTTSGSTFASPTGAYAVSTRSSGGLVSNPTASEAQSNLTFFLTNSTGIAQNFFLNMKIYGGSLSTSVFDPAGLTLQEFLRTGYDAKVTRVTNPANNTRTTLFSSSATVERNVDGTTFASSGTTLTGADSSIAGQYSWATDFYNIDLGVLDAGAFMQIDANLYGFSRSAVGTYNFSGGCGYENVTSQSTDEAAAVPVQACFKGEARQFYGDPLGASGQDVFSFTTVPVANSVPEPGSLLLAGAALGAAGLVRRRRRVTSAQ